MDPSDLPTRDDARRRDQTRDGPHPAPRPPAPSPGPAPPVLLLGGRYELVAELGRGAMGVVYRAREPASGRHVALKLLLLQTGSRAKERVERLRREAEITASLRHPGIVLVHAAGEVEGQPFVTYELIEGCRTLDQVFEDPGVDLRRRVELVRDAARAVGFAHARGVLHRDLKPANVLIDATGRVRVADFGLATAEGLERLTQTGMIVGTPVAMAPEQITASPLGPPADVWALGVLLYLALTGRLPFDAPSLIELSVQVCTQRPDPPRRHAPAVSRALEAVCLQALARRPRDRFPDAGAFADALDRALDAPPPSPRRALVVAGLVATVAVAAGAVALLSGPPLTPPPPDPTPSAVARPAPGRAGPLLAFVSRAGSGERLDRQEVQRLAREATPEDVASALEHLEADPATAPIRRLRIASWVRDAAPTSPAGAPAVFDRWLAEAWRHHDAATSEARRAEQVSYGMEGAPPLLVATEALAEALGAALLLGRSPYDVDPMLSDPLALLSGITIRTARKNDWLRDELAPLGPRVADAHLLAAWGATLPDDADVSRLHRALERLEAVAPTSEPAVGWRAAQDSLVDTLRWKRGVDALALCRRCSARPVVGHLVLSLHANAAGALAESAGPPEERRAGLEEARRALARIPADKRQPGVERLGARLGAVSLSLAPAWFRGRAPEARPPALLPDGLWFSDTPDTYVNARDGSLLAWIAPQTFALKSGQRVAVTQGFFVGVREVTKEQWRRFAPTQAGDARPSDAFDPVTDVTWNEAAAYCEWAGLRLPWEIEFELVRRTREDLGGSIDEWLADAAWDLPAGPHLVDPRGPADGPQRMRRGSRRQPANRTTRDATLGFRVAR